jgi:hypothetical protein
MTGKARILCRWKYPHGSRMVAVSGTATAREAWLKQPWVIPPKAKPRSWPTWMEDELAVYTRPYDADRPVV